MTGAPPNLTPALMELLISMGVDPSMLSTMNAGTLGGPKTFGVPGAPTWDPGQMFQPGDAKPPGAPSGLQPLSAMPATMLGPGGVPSMGGIGMVPGGGGGGGGPTNPLVDGFDPVNDAGFLSKPESEHGGEYVILTPPTWGEVTGASVNGVPGRFTGYANPMQGGGQGRGHWRFGQPGSSFGPNAQVTFTFRDGSSRTVTIPDPGQRWGVGY